MFGINVRKMSDVPRRVRISIAIMSRIRRNAPRIKRSPRKRNAEGVVVARDTSNDLQVAVMKKMHLTLLVVIKVFQILVLTTVTRNQTY